MYVYYMFSNVHHSYFLAGRAWVYNISHYWWNSCMSTHMVGWSDLDHSKYLLQIYRCWIIYGKSWRAISLPLLLITANALCIILSVTPIWSQRNRFFSRFSSAILALSIAINVYATCMLCTCDTRFMRLIYTWNSCNSLASPAGCKSLQQQAYTPPQCMPHTGGVWVPIHCNEHPERNPNSWSWRSLCECRGGNRCRSKHVNWTDAH